MAARREGLSEQRREGDWRRPERAKTGRDKTRMGKSPGAPETDGSGRNSDEGKDRITFPEPRACGSVGGSKASDCKVMASKEARNTWTYVGEPENAKAGPNAGEGGRARAGQTDFQPYWGKPTVRNEWRGLGKHGQQCLCAPVLLDLKVPTQLGNQGKARGFDRMNRMKACPSASEQFQSPCVPILSSVVSLPRSFGIKARPRMNAERRMQNAEVCPPALGSSQSHPPHPVHPVKSLPPVLESR